jgi:hypothetical protein
MPAPIVRKDKTPGWGGPVLEKQFGLQRPLTSPLINQAPKMMIFRGERVPPNALDIGNPQSGKGYRESLWILELDGSPGDFVRRLGHYLPFRGFKEKNSLS